MKKALLGLFLIGSATQIFAQVTEQLPEIVIVHNYKYLSDVGSEDLAIPVEKLHVKVSDFNVKELDIYADEYDYYDVYFIIPEGKILASYDKDGNLLRTVERFRDIDLPMPLLKAIVKRFPKWIATSDVYVVNYKESGVSKKLYKLTLENGDQRIKIKMDDLGNFLKN